MTFVRLRFDVAGDVQLSRAFEADAHDVADMSEPLAAIGHLVQRTVGEQFGTEGARAGQRWRPLSPKYEAWKDAHYPGRPLLVQTGDMRAAALARDAVDVTPRRMVYEIDDPKAIYHQTGAGDLPERELVRLVDGDKRQVERTFHEWLNALRHRPMGAR